MGLPFQGSYESVCILQDKSKFRKFLSDNKFNVPNAKGYTNLNDALADVDYFNWPVIVKPVDSAGSKGVSRVDTPNDLAKAIEYALSEAHNGHFIIEDFLEKEGNTSDSDCFTVDGKLVFVLFLINVLMLMLLIHIPHLLSVGHLQCHNGHKTN